MDDAEATADQMFRDLMNKVFPVAPRNGTAKRGLTHCKRCHQLARIPPNRQFCRGCWLDMGRPPPVPVYTPRFGGVAGRINRRVESGGIAYHGGQFNAGEW